MCVLLDVDCWGLACSGCRWHYQFPLKRIDRDLNLFMLIISFENVYGFFVMKFFYVMIKILIIPSKNLKVEIEIFNFKIDENFYLYHMNKNKSKLISESEIFKFLYIIIKLTCILLWQYPPGKPICKLLVNSMK